jgi:EAL domain-containing protein (putative c-di-GMP-specific phosphodiesterase class I)
LQGYAFGRPMSGDQITTLLTGPDLKASATA